MKNRFHIAIRVAGGGLREMTSWERLIQPRCPSLLHAAPLLCGQTMTRGPRNVVMLDPEGNAKNDELPFPSNASR
jgi:hypothetical protein